MHSHYQIREDDAATTHHPVDDIEPMPTDDTMERTLDAFRVIFAWILGGYNKPDAYTSRLLVLALHLDMECGVGSYEDIAQIVGSTRANVQLQGKDIERRFGLRYNGSRRDSTRLANKRQAMRQHAQL